MENEGGTSLKIRDSAGKRSARTTLLDSGEDLEMVEEADDGVDDDLPPLEDAGGGKKESNRTEKTEPGSPEPSQCPGPEEWLDVLGTSSFTCV